MHKINDRIILGLVVGLLANIPKTISCETLYHKGITKRKCSDLAASIFIPTYKVSSNKGNIFGILCDSVVACFDGIAYIYLLTSTGKVNKSNALIKGMISGLLSFGLFRGIISKVGTGKIYPKDIFTNIMMGINSSIWGVTAGLLTLLLGHKDLFEPKPHIFPIKYGQRKTARIFHPCG
ncbi:MAG: hypothetical protein P4L69_24390 [Desulfosporosinus sp.]|nr:hypothetical protein [Desulfosporosinus sp.]